MEAISRKIAAGAPLAPEHERAIEAWLAPLRARLGSAALSDYCFSNLYMFRQVHAYRYHAGPLPFVSGRTYDGMPHVLPLFDLARVSPLELRQHLPPRACLFPLDESMARALDEDSFALSASEEDADYLYAAESLRDYHGPLLRKKAAQIRHWDEGDLQPVAEPLGAHNRMDALIVLQGWMRDKRMVSGAADEHACREALQEAKALGLKGTLYRLHDEPVGFLLAQELAPAVQVMRFAKGRDHALGIYPWMFRDHCRRHSELKWLNFEQDLGNPGFRQAKRSYQPAALLDKWRAQLLQA